MHDVNRITETLAVHLTDEELIDIGSRLASSTQRLSALEAKKKRLMAEIKKEITTVLEEQENLSNSAASRTAYRDVACMVYFDTPTAGHKTIIREDTGAKVRVEGMTLAERQMTLRLEEETKQEARAADEQRKIDAAKAEAAKVQQEAQDLLAEEEEALSGDSESGDDTPPKTVEEEEDPFGDDEAPPVDVGLESPSNVIIADAEDFRPVTPTGPVPAPEKKARKGKASEPVTVPDPAKEAEFEKIDDE